MNALTGIPGSAPVPVAGEGVPPSRTFSSGLEGAAISCCGKVYKVRFGETPKPAPETGALPGDLLHAL